MRETKNTGPGTWRRGWVTVLRPHVLISTWPAGQYQSASPPCARSSISFRASRLYFVRPRKL